MKDKKTLSIKVTAVTRNKEPQPCIYLASLNEARFDERKNQAVRMSSRLESMAAFIIKHDMNCRETAEVLRQEAERISNESLETLQ